MIRAGENSLGQSPSSLNPGTRTSFCSHTLPSSHDDRTSLCRGPFCMQRGPEGGGLPSGTPKPFPNAPPSLIPRGCRLRDVLESFYLWSWNSRCQLGISPWMPLPPQTLKHRGKCTGPGVCTETWSSAKGGDFQSPFHVLFDSQLLRLTGPLFWCPAARSGPKESSYCSYSAVPQTLLYPFHHGEQTFL